MRHDLPALPPGPFAREADDDQPTLDIVAPAPTTTAKKTKRPAREIARTDTGESAQDIVGSWVAWVEGATGVPLPRAMISRVGKQVRLLIDSTYSTVQIKNGLAVWTVELMDNPRLSPVQLDSFTWQYALDTSARANSWRATMRSRVASFGGRRTPKADRRENTVQAAVRMTENWSHQ